MTEIPGLRFFGLEHFLIILITCSLCIWLPLFARQKLERQHRMWVQRGLSMIICCGILTAIIFPIAVGSFDWREDLPLHLCDLFALILPLLFWKHLPRRLIEIFYYIIAGGTVQGVLTPDLSEAFPHPLYFSYWIVHSGLVLYIVYVVRVWRIYPRFMGIVKSFLWLNVYALLMLIFNYLAGSNYLFLMDKPQFGSILDLLGPWPWYILVAQPLAVVIFWLCWLPFAKVTSSDHNHARQVFHH